MRSRDVNINVRVTAAEKRKIKAMANRCGLSLSAYLRIAGMDKTLKALPADKLHSVYEELKKIRDSCAEEQELYEKLDRVSTRLMEIYTEGD